jgi:hypothetical protein
VRTVNDLNTAGNIAESGAVDIDTDEVSLNHITTGKVEQDAVISVAGNHVARAGHGAADDIVT